MASNRNSVRLRSHTNTVFVNIERALFSLPFNDDRLIGFLFSQKSRSSVINTLIQSESSFYLTESTLNRRCGRMLLLF